MIKFKAVLKDSQCKDGIWKYTFWHREETSPSKEFILKMDYKSDLKWIVTNRQEFEKLELIDNNEAI